MTRDEGLPKRKVDKEKREKGMGKQETLVQENGRRRNEGINRV